MRGGEKGGKEVRGTPCWWGESSTRERRQRERKVTGRIRKERASGKERRQRQKERRQRERERSDQKERKGRRRWRNL